MPRIDVALNQSTHEAYMKMIKTAYELAIISNYASQALQGFG
jgi:hypothetical protein